ncbi:MAG: bifunctional diaminohydroxyphosphoribosylaminopyrimidine deaminase/5-amino-6-(5-phosphoribosylamino)uracil reductase RibD [Desulfotignum sp.]|nr:bifunctional diaminohydroxyphosphoribosylaminopyrimidine deaminase/5-amino-6-(5-phosphoribosylamino)uracil reductase RibD [Desulfotignum sp.]MCF8125486.1 bifunctional diaminohydroxyphosphoribosylaminopyrimidine deaminase/5-amino-6-(5-phosphoribosylamino)uracil reductase RibD [Desulfotignum sp.]
MTDKDHMQLALALAARGKGFTSPNPCVGAVVVKDGEVVGRGWHRAFGAAHAEVKAIDDAGNLARGADLFVTLEPCNHFGKTGPCTHKILEAGIRRVVAACPDPNPVASGGLDFLSQNGVQVGSGLLRDQAETLMEDFLWYIRHNRAPFVILKCAATLDGRIATSTGESQWITCERSRAFSHEIRHQADAILVGSGTLHADNPSLTCRIPGKKTRDPARVILDTHLLISETANVINLASTAPTIIVTGPHVPEEKKQRLLKKKVQFLEVNLKNNRLDLRQLMVKLGEMSITSLLIEGGGTVASSALSEGIVNKIIYFLAPRMLGGSDGKAVFEGRGVEKLADAVTLNHISVERLDTDILIQGYVK